VTSNARLTGTILPAALAQPVADGIDAIQTPVSVDAPGTPSNPLKRKASDTADENSQEQKVEDVDSPTKGLKPIGRPKKPVDPEKVAKVRHAFTSVRHDASYIIANRRRRNLRRS
jgi:hypothetical protein